VFLPIGFMGGIIGKFFHEFGVTIVAAVLISMFVSFTLDPMLSSVWHDPSIHRRGTADGPATLYDRTLGRLTGLVERFSQWLGGLYEGILGWSLRHKLATLAIALASLIASFALLPLLGTEFVPRADFGETNVSFYTPTGSSLEVTEARARQVDAILRSLPEVDYTVTTINTGTAPGRNEASIFVRLVDRGKRTRNVDQLSAPLRERLSGIPGITVTQVGLLEAVGGQKPVRLSIQGDDLNGLQRLTGQLLPRLREVPGLVDLDTSMRPSKPTIDVVVRREAASDLGSSVGSITSTLRALVAGDTVGNWRAPNDETYDVRVSLKPKARSSSTDLERLALIAGQNNDGSARVVRLGQVASIVPAFGADQINRRDLNREVEITANVSGRSLGEVSADIRDVLDTVDFPPGYRASFGGSAQDMQESFGYALSALALAVIFIYMILASQFKSFLQPIALMSSLPLTLIGVALMLLFFGSTVNLFSIIGVVMLMGLVTKNAILLVDFANRAREGRSGEEAPLEGGAGAALEGGGAGAAVAAGGTAREAVVSSG
ncbi:MAG: efflux RND transporter permease subunit, partial [Gammaproteobacteria bacterium]